MSDLVELHANETLFNMGDVGDAFYLIVRGSCDVVVSSVVAVLGPGDR